MSYRICLLIADYNIIGGGERVASNMANYFSTKYSYDVTILSIRNISKKYHYKLSESVTINSIGLSLSSKNIIGKIWEKFGSFMPLVRYLRGSKFDYVLGIGGYPSLLISLFRSSETILVGCEHTSLSSVPIAWDWLRKLLYPRLDAVVALTDGDQERLSGYTKRALTITNSRSFFPKNPSHVNNKVLLAVGRLDYYKGFDTLISVFAKINRHCPLWELRIIGEGPGLISLQGQIYNLGLEKKVKIMPATRNIEKEYINSSIYIMTSRHEGLPMTLIEAQACGLPIVSFDCPTGPSEIISHEINGYLIEPGKIDEMVNKILILINNEPLRKRFSQAARESSDRYSESVVFKQWKNLFDSYRA